MVPLLLVMLLASPLGDNKTAQPTIDHSGQDWIAERSERSVRFENDGTSQEQVFRRVRVQTDAGVRVFGQLGMAYDSAREQVEFRNVQVRKQDGRVVAAPLAQVVEVTAPIGAAFPVYSDLRLKQLPVPDLRPGDVLEYTIARTLKTPLAAGQFWATHTFARFEIVLDEVLEISVPLGRPLKTKMADGIEPSVTEAGGRRSYRFTHKTTHPQDVEAARRRLQRQLSSGAPDVVLSSFQSWAELAVWYEALEREQRAPTPAIREKAAELTKGLREDRDRIEALYAYVGTKVRYVGISFGLSAVRPHPAGETLANGYGDCKDKHTLLAALLAAIGLQAHAALVSTSTEVDSAVPYLAFDHVISVVPLGGENLWLDTTTEVAPFGWLPPTLREKQALVVSPGGGGRVMETPGSATPSETLTELTGSVADDGRLVAHRRESCRGDAEVPIRLALRLAPQETFKQGVGKGLQAEADVHHLTATLGEFRTSDPSDTRDPMTLDADYTIAKVLDLSEKRSRMRLPGPSLRLPALDDLPLSSGGRPFLGGPVTTRFHARIELPAGWSPDLPEGVSVDKGFAEYRVEYGFDQRTLRIDRVLTLKAGEIATGMEAEYQQFRDTVRTNHRESFTVRNRTAYEKDCEGGMGDACNELAGIYASGDGVAKDESHAAVLYERGCAASHAEACTYLALAYKNGRGVDKEPTRVKGLYEKGCELGDTDGCGRLGSLYAEGDGVEQDPAKAAALYQRGCDGGEAWVCSKLAYAYDQGIGVSKDAVRAAKLFQKACDGDDANACVNLGYDHENGKGVPKDEVRAAALYRKACNDGSPEGCTRLGVAHENGRGVEKDPVKAVELYTRGCDAGNAWGCSCLGYTYAAGVGVEKDTARAAVFYQKACDGGYPHGCSGLAALYQLGAGVTKDEARAFASYKRACEGGYADGCFRLAWAYADGRGVDQSLESAFSTFEKACDLGSADGCSATGFAYVRGTGVAQDLMRGVGYFKKACDQGLLEPCALLGEAYWHGSGGLRRDKERAVEYLQKACEGGIAAGCSTWGLTFAFHSRDTDHPEASVRADDARALALFKKGCDGGDARGCGFLGSLYRYGTGVPKDMTLFRALARRACDGGYQPSCAELEADGKN